MRHLFVSYVEEDAAVAHDLASGLEAAGYRAWYYERDSLPGASYLSQVPRAIADSLLMLVVISRATLPSWQVDKEIVQGHELGRAFMPLLRGISHAEFRAARPDWAMAMGAATALTLPPEGARAAVPRLVEGLRALGALPTTTEPLSPFGRTQQARRRAPRARTLLLGLGAAVLALVISVAVVLATHRHTATPADPVAKAASGLFVPLAGPTLGHTLRGPFLAFYQRYGGATVFGRPRTESIVEGGVTRQYSDRFLLEQRGGVVTTAPLGRLLTAGQVFTRVARPAGHPTRQLYFPTTGHILADQFLTYWQTHHGSVVLGAPISELIMEKNDDGTGATYQLQWCEKGRLEFHSEQMLDRYHVMLGLLGVAALRQRGWLPSSE